jgi:hypothetical protein
MTMVDMYVVNNDIGYILQSNAAAADNVDVSPTPIESLVAVKDELLRELDEHVAGEHNPERLSLNHSIS